MMKIIIATLSVLMLTASSLIGQKLYVQENPISELSVSYDSMSDYTDMIEAKHKDNSKSLDLKGLNKRMFETIGDCKNVAMQSNNAERVTQSILDKSMIHESEYQEYLKTLPNAGYFDYNRNTKSIAVLNTETLKMESLRKQIKSNKFEFQPGQVNAEKNIELLKQFNNSLNSILTSLEKVYVEL